MDERGFQNNQEESECKSSWIIRSFAIRAVTVSCCASNLFFSCAEPGGVREELDACCSSRGAASIRKLGTVKTRDLIQLV